MGPAESITEAHLREVFNHAEIIHDSAAVAEALDAMANSISEAYAGTQPLFLGVMTGAIVPLGRLLPRLDFALELDYIHATRYHGSTTGRDLLWLARPQTPLKGRHVVVVDDILDEGTTLAGILQECHDQGAASVATAVLVDKRHERRVPGLEAQFVGLEVPDRYVFGAGMDYRGYFRNAAGIYAIAEAFMDAS
jgi:hypoxanthine phosphoribosyltransferase